MREYFERLDKSQKLDSKDTQNKYKLKNEIKFTFQEKLDKKENEIRDKYPECFDLVPRFRQHEVDEERWIWI